MLYSFRDETASTTRNGSSPARCAPAPRPAPTARRRRRSRSRPRECGSTVRSGRASARASAPLRPSVPAVRGRRVLPPGRARGRSRRGSSARLDARPASDAVKTSERLNFAPRCSRRRAPCASGRRAWRRCASGGWRPSARPGTAPRPPRGSSGPRRPGPRRAARLPSAPLRACARRCGRARSRAFSTQVAAPSSLEAGERRLDRVAAPRFCRARRRTTPSASSARARPYGSPTASCSATACSKQRRGLLDAPLGCGNETAATRHLREHPLTVDARWHPPPSRRRCAPLRRARPSSSSSSTWSALHQRTLGSRHPSAAARRVGLAEPLEPPPDWSPLQSATRPRIARCCGGWSAELLVGELRALARSARARARADRDGRRRPRSAGDPAAPRARTGSRCRVRARRGRPRAPSAQPRTRPTRDPRARGRSAARRARATPGPRARAASRACALTDDGAKRVHEGQHRLLDQLVAADRVREVARARGKIRRRRPRRRRTSRGSPAPRERALGATSSSSSLGEPRAPRAHARAPVESKRRAQARRQWMSA